MWLVRHTRSFLLFGGTGWRRVVWNMRGGLWGCLLPGLVSMGLEESKARERGAEEMGAGNGWQGSSHGVVKKGSEEMGGHDGQDARSKGTYDCISAYEVCRLSVNMYKI